MLFGILCTAAIVYGTVSIFSGIVSTLVVPRSLKSGTKYVVEKLDETRQALNLRHGEGIYDDTIRLVLAEFFPRLTEIELPEELQEILYKVHWLTDKEVEELKLVAAPLSSFEKNFPTEKFPLHWASVLHQQREPTFRALIAFFKEIPKERIAKS